MFAPVVFLGLLVAAAAWHRLRVLRRRREQRAMVVPTYPDIELRQMYGGWDADAYDGYNARSVAPRTGRGSYVGPTAPRLIQAVERHSRHR